VDSGQRTHVQLKNKYITTGTHAPAQSSHGNPAAALGPTVQPVTIELMPPRHFKPFHNVDCIQWECASQTCNRKKKHEERKKKEKEKRNTFERIERLEQSQHQQ
jgi:hypothetical protein